MPAIAMLRQWGDPLTVSVRELTGGSKAQRCPTVNPLTRIPGKTEWMSPGCVKYYFHCLRGGLSHENHEAP
jgi:hypothetical protein